MFVSCGCSECCQVEVSATGRSLVRGILPTEVCATECDYENLNLRRPRPKRAVELREK
jgi:hypothetical protein